MQAPLAHSSTMNEVALEEAPTTGQWGPQCSAFAVDLQKLRLRAERFFDIVRSKSFDDFKPRHFPQ